VNAWVIGNGPSRNDTPLERLCDQRTFACHRIWRIFDKTTWRPTDYVRAELPDYEGGMVREDLARMAREDATIWIQAGFFAYAGEKGIAFGRDVRPFLTCNGNENHEWHPDDGNYICGYGTVVNMSIQLAILEGAEKVFLLGCDLGNSHFYGTEGVDQGEKSVNAHMNALKSSPVPIYVYPRMGMDEALRSG